MIKPFILFNIKIFDKIHCWSFNKETLNVKKLNLKLMSIFTTVLSSALGFDVQVKISWCYTFTFCLMVCVNKVGLDRVATGVANYFVRKRNQPYSTLTLFLPSFCVFFLSFFLCFFLFQQIFSLFPSSSFSSAYLRVLHKLTQWKVTAELPLKLFCIKSSQKMNSYCTCWSVKTIGINTSISECENNTKTANCNLWQITDCKYFSIGIIRHRLCNLCFRFPSNFDVPMCSFFLFFFSVFFRSFFCTMSIPDLMSSLIRFCLTVLLFSQTRSTKKYAKEFWKKKNFQLFFDLKKVPLCYKSVSWIW